MTTDHDAFVHFQTAAADAPEGTFEDVKALRQAIGEAVDGFMRTLRTEHGLDADSCDHAFALEVAIYRYVKVSNPDQSLFDVAEGFGQVMSGADAAEKERVLSNARPFAAGRGKANTTPFAP